MSESSDRAIDLAFCRELGVLYDGLMRAIITDGTSLESAKAKARMGVRDAYLAMNIMRELIRETENASTKTT